MRQLGTHKMWPETPQRSAPPDSLLQSSESPVRRTRKTYSSLPPSLATPRYRNSSTDMAGTASRRAVGIVTRHDGWTRELSYACHGRASMELYERFPGAAWRMNISSFSPTFRSSPDSTLNSPFYFGLYYSLHLKPSEIFGNEKAIGHGR